MLALVGVINVPIIYFSVQWWNTLHQGATIRILGKPTIAAPMLTAMLIMLAACWLYSVAVVLSRLRCIILETGAERFPLRGGERLIMQWPDLSMGGYGFYVWGSYLFSLIVIVWELVSLRQRKKALVKDEQTSAVRATVLRGSTNETTS